MSDLEEQLQEFESIQSIYDSHKLSFDQHLITKLVTKQINTTMHFPYFTPSQNKQNKHKIP